VTNSTDRPRRRKLRQLPGRIIGRTPWLRRRYARWMLKTIKKHRDKGRPLPENLRLVERQLRQVPPTKRLEMLEQTLEAGTALSESNVSRAMRRAAERQERQSGRRGGGQRPGLPPGTRRR
jgi:hypothetical protein